MNKEQLKKELKEATAKLVRGVRVMSAVAEMECPGCGHMVFDALIEEVDKLRSKPAPEKGKANRPEPSNDLMWTAELMGSADYKERFKAEYHQLKIRHDKLHEILVAYGADQLDFELTCDVPLLHEQKKAMRMYLDILEVRAKIEGIEL